MDKYKAQMGEIQYTQKGKDILMENVKSSKKAKTQVVKLALLLAMLSTITVTAYAVQNPIDILSPIFGGSSAQTEIIGKIGVPINASDTSNGITITAEAIIGSKNSASIVYKISNADGSTITLPQGADVNSLTPTGGFGTQFNMNYGSHGSRRGELSQDGHYRIIETISTDVDIPNGARVTTTFKDLTYFNEEGYIETFVEGDWKIKYEFSYQDATENIEVNEIFTREGQEFTVKDIDISPISVNVNYEVNSVPSFFEEDFETANGYPTQARIDETELYLNGVELIITTKDGLILDLSNAGGKLSNNTTHTEGCKSTTFDEIISLEDIASIQVGEIVVAVDF